MIKTLIVVTCILLGASVTAQEMYRTILGTYYEIEDQQAKLVSDSTVLKPTIVNGETLSRKELKKITKLEKLADSRELAAYQAMKVNDLQKATSDKSRVKLYNKARDIAALVKRLRTSNDIERVQLYSRIGRLTADYNPSLSASISTPKIKTEKAPKPEVFEFKRDQRPIWEILANKDCEIVFDGFDQGLDTKRKETNAVHLFGYTHPNLRRHFADNDYMTTIASMAKIGRDYYIVMQIDINSKSASKHYGKLVAGEKVRLRLVDGKTIYGQLVNTQAGKLQEYTGHTIYNPLIKIHKDDLKKLQNDYLDDIGLMWSTGFENYEVYHVDALQNIAKCIRR